MGFTKPKAIPTEHNIPVVTDNETETTRSAHEQGAARRRGLLSTLLGGAHPAPSASGDKTGNTTLG